MINLQVYIIRCFIVNQTSCWQFITSMLYLVHKLSCLLQLAIHNYKRGRLIAVENVAMRKREGTEFGRYDLLIAGHNWKPCRAWTNRCWTVKPTETLVAIKRERQTSGGFIDIV